MKDEMRSGKKQLVVAMFVAATLLIMTVAPAANVSAAERLTDPEFVDGKWIDGIDNDAHNSYAWCGAMFTQYKNANGDGTDYLWVGTNRDIGTGIIALVPGLELNYSDVLYSVLGMPAPGEDTSGKIYRLNMNDPDGKWEVMYEDPVFNGYRKMVIFNGDLYVFGGLTNYEYNYSAVFRFGPDFETGDEPEAVMWGALPDGEIQYYRSAFVDEKNNRLFVGTFDGKIFCTDGNISTIGPADIEDAIANNVTPGGWDLVINLGIPAWDIIFFNNSLYVFFSGASGFLVYKLTLVGSNWVPRQIVGGIAGTTSASYPRGLGVEKNISGSPFLYVDSTGKEYVYVSTLSNGPMFLSVLGFSLIDALLLPPGSKYKALQQAFDSLYCPATIYRFDDKDNWEVIVGDSVGKNVAVDKNGYPVPFAPSADMRAGFFPGTDTFPTNPSSNLYMWWMAQDANGRLWASTWDMGIFREALFNSISSDRNIFMILLIDMLMQNDEISDIAAPIMDVYNDLMTIVDELSGMDPDLADNIGGLLTNATSDIMAIAAGEPGDIMNVITQLMGDVASELSTIIDITDLRASIGALYNRIEGMTDDETDSVMTTITAAYKFVLYVYDTSNPSGFDLFYSDDGVTWNPYTVNGMGDNNNYGGRVILPTEYGLIVLTANPFTGCQVWILNDTEREINADVPASATMDVGGSVTFYVQTVGVDPDSISVTVGDGTVVKADKADIVMVKEDRTIYASAVTLKPGIVYGGYEWAEDGGYAYKYEVTLTGLKAFKGTLPIYIETGELRFEGSIDLLIGDPADPKTAKSGDEGVSVILIVAVAAAAIAAISAAYLILIRPKP
jgi:hypothetical protein